MTDNTNQPWMPKIEAQEFNRTCFVCMKNKTKDDSPCDECLACLRDGAIAMVEINPTASMLESSEEAVRVSHKDVDRHRTGRIMWVKRAMLVMMIPEPYMLQACLTDALTFIDRRAFEAMASAVARIRGRMH